MSLLRMMTTQLGNKHLPVPLEVVRSKSPCKKECKLGEDKQSCEVCHRTIKEIEEYGKEVKRRNEKATTGDS